MHTFFLIPQVLILDLYGLCMIQLGKCQTLTLSTFFAGFTSLFTCGGQGASTHVDITILPSSEGSHQNRTCNEVPEIPSSKYDNFAMWDDHDKSVLCCGGEPSLQHKRCYKYTGDEWIDLGEILKHQRYHSRAVELSDGRYWISGGAHGYELPNLWVLRCTELGKIESHWCVLSLTLAWGQNHQQFWVGLSSLEWEGHCGEVLIDKTLFIFSLKVPISHADTDITSSTKCSTVWAWPNLCIPTLLKANAQLQWAEQSPMWYFQQLATVIVSMIWPTCSQTMQLIAETGCCNCAQNRAQTFVAFKTM